MGEAFAWFCVLMVTCVALWVAAFATAAVFGWTEADLDDLIARVAMFVAAWWIANRVVDR